MGKKRKLPSLSEQLRQAILNSEKSRYRLWKETGVAQESLSRFVNGSGNLSMEAADLIAAALNLELVTRKAK